MLIEETAVDEGEVWYPPAQGCFQGGPAVFSEEQVAEWVSRPSMRQDAEAAARAAWLTDAAEVPFAT